MLHTVVEIVVAAAGLLFLFSISSSLSIRILSTGVASKRVAAHDRE